MGNMRKIWATVAFVLVSFVFTSPAFAGNIGAQRITMLAVYNTAGSPYAVVQFPVNSTGPAACAHTNFTSFMTFDTTTNKGKVLLSLLTAAFLAGKPVSVIGSGNACLSPDGFMTATGIVLETIDHALVGQ